MRIVGFDPVYGRDVEGAIPNGFDENESHCDPRNRDGRIKISSTASLVELIWRVLDLLPPLCTQPRRSRRAASSGPGSARWDFHEGAPRLSVLGSPYSSIFRCCKEARALSTAPYSL